MIQSTGTPMPGVDFIISKPFLLENLREAIRGLPRSSLEPSIFGSSFDIPYFIGER